MVEVMIVKSGEVNDAQKARLHKAGVVVVEVTHPSDVRLESTENDSALLKALCVSLARAILKDGNFPTRDAGEAVANMIVERFG